MASKPVANTMISSGYSPLLVFTPVAVIRGATELMLAQHDLPEKTRQRLLRIDRAARQSNELIEALLL